MRGSSLRCSFWIAASAAFAMASSSETADAGWFDSATGQPVQTIPLSSDPTVPGLNARAGDPDYARVGDKNLYRDKACGTWRDSATGEEVRTIPLSSDPTTPGLNARTGDRDRASVGGKNLFWRPCPPPSESSTANPPPPSQTVAPLLPPALPILPGVGFGFGFGGQRDDHGPRGR